ncbi:MAG: imidazolonepropionase [bacterium]
MKKLLKNLNEIVSCHSADSFIVLGEDADILSEGDCIGIEDGKIIFVGKNAEEEKYDEVIDCSGCIAVPGFTDSHTHLVFHGTREDEFEMRVKGMTYKDIASAGGGIKRSVKMTREATEEDLFDEAKERLKIFISKGVTSIEIKSGYGLDRETELKQLRVIRNLKDEFKINIKATYLGAHEIPNEYRERRDDYIKFMIEEMIPFIADEKLADYVDVFCEKGVYTQDETVRILEAGKRHGLEGRVHADEIDFSGGSTAAAEMKTKSVDHFNIPDRNDLEALKNNKTVITLLPATNFLLRIKTRPPIEAMRKIKNTIAISTDFNPGSSPVMSILLAAGIGMINYNLLPKELMPAITLNPSYSLGLSDRTGSIREGKDADIVVFRRNNYSQLFYFFGEDKPNMVFCKGERVIG